MENKEFIICRPVPTDTRGIQDVFYRTWIDTYPNSEIGITVEDIEEKFKDAFTEETLKKREAKILNPPKGHLTLIARKDNTVVAICNFIETQDSIKLSTLYVLPEFQGKGIGRMLWDEGRTHLDLNKDMYVEVATYNTKAIEFYKKLGFQDTGRRFSEDKFIFKSGAILPEMEMVIKAKK